MSLTGGLSFLLGRIVFIETYTVHQLAHSKDVPVFGDLSQEDIVGAQALEGVFEVRCDLSS